MPNILPDLPNAYRQNLNRAVEILQDAGCSDVFLFGSLTHGNIHEGTDIDLAVRGCPAGQYFNILGKLFYELDYPVDLINLDKPDAFAHFLEDQGELVQIA
ncbi:MAG: nucleotidyltransferase domain-containing protein [Caldilineaceae bacterium]|nr:nucleotidyltransferase domain-containing protein [Caldilineaceae bacterium]MCB0083393.1 nucleotidyltransferase domain-containing protein [Caldilineaceae bacterium]